MKDLILTNNQDPAVVSAAASVKARIEASYIMALNKPRNEDQARIRILEACKRPVFAERVEFSKPIGVEKVTGPTIRFAELALREWGNVLVETQTIYEDDSNRRIKVSVLDLETNAAFSKEIQIKKTVERKNTLGREIVGERINTSGKKVFVVLATDDELQNKENALISKAVRNEGLRLIPSDITDEALVIAGETMRNKFSEDPKAEKKKILDAFAGVGVKPNDIEKYLKHNLDTVSPSEIQELRGMYQAIKDGEASWSSYVSEAEEKEKLKKSLDDKIKQGQKPLPKKEAVAEKEIPKKEQKPESATGLGLVKCPTDDEPKTLKACERTCEGDMFEKKTCLARFPEK